MQRSIAPCHVGCVNRYLSPNILCYTNFMRWWNVDDLFLQLVLFSSLTSLEISVFTCGNQIPGETFWDIIYTFVSLTGSGCQILLDISCLCSLFMLLAPALYIAYKVPFQKSNILSMLSSFVTPVKLSSLWIEQALKLIWRPDSLSPAIWCSILLELCFKFLTCCFILNKNVLNSLFSKLTLSLVTAGIAQMKLKRLQWLCSISVSQ